MTDLTLINSEPSNSKITPPIVSGRHWSGELPERVDARDLDAVERDAEQTTTQIAERDKYGRVRPGRVVDFRNLSEHARRTEVQRKLDALAATRRAQDELSRAADDRDRKRCTCGICGEYDASTGVLVIEGQQLHDRACRPCRLAAVMLAPLCEVSSERLATVRHVVFHDRVPSDFTDYQPPS